MRLVFKLFNRITSAAVIQLYCYYTMLLKKIQAFYKFFSFFRRYTFAIFVVYFAFGFYLDDDYRLQIAGHMH